MFDFKFIETVAERDIDLLVLEELSVSEKFRKWFASLVFGEPVYRSNVGTWHSVNGNNLGESDLVFLFVAENATHSAILIENKIDASPMPMQGERYRQRGRKGIQNGQWEKFKTCIIAPKKYLVSAKNPGVYDVEIGYEEIHSYFVSRSNQNPRFAYKAEILLEGIQKNRRGYQPETNEQMTNFVKQYSEFANKNFPELNIQEATPKPAGANWIEFYPDSLPPEGLGLAHQMTSGFVKLFFKGQAKNYETILENYKSRLTEQMSIGVAGHSVAISMRVPKLAPLRKNFNEQREKVIVALQCLSQLSLLLSRNNSL
jgi:hypothetical protein